MRYVIPFGISLILSFKTVAVSVLQPDFAQAIPGQECEYQQRAAHD